MSKFLIELELEESIEDWLTEMRWKRNHDYKAFEATLAECKRLLREEMAAARSIERERFTKICESMIEEYEEKHLDERRGGNELGSHYAGYAQTVRLVLEKIRGEE